MELQFQGPGGNIKALNNRAYCYAKLAEYDHAIEDYSLVIEMDNQNIHALHNRGISLERQGKYKEVSSLSNNSFRQ